MAIQIAGTTVIDNSRNLTNIVSYGGPGIATEAEAQAGSNNNQLMTPLRVAQAIAALSSSTVIKRIQRGMTTVTGRMQTASPQTTFPGNPDGTTNVPLTSVSTSKSMVNMTYTADANMWEKPSTNVPYIYPGQAGYARMGVQYAPTPTTRSPAAWQISVSAQLTSGTNLRLKNSNLDRQYTAPHPSTASGMQSGLTWSAYASWEVIEFI